MAYIEGSKGVTRHVYFSPKENGQIETWAWQAGMEIVPYIRHMALHGIVRSVDLSAVRKHGEQIGEVLRAVRQFTEAPHPDRWLYEADLERLEDKLTELVALETAILQSLQERR